MLGKKITKVFKCLQLAMLRTLSALSVLFFAASVKSQTIDFATAPLFIDQAARPNILFLLDDSGSLFWEAVFNGGIIGNDEAFSGNFTAGSFSAECFARGGFDYQQRLCEFMEINDLRGLLPNTFSQRVSLRRALLRRCPEYNTLAYNPNVEYGAWQGIDINNEIMRSIEINDLNGGLSNNTQLPGYLDPFYATDNIFTGETIVSGLARSDIRNVLELNNHFYFQADAGTSGNGVFDSNECGVLDLTRRERRRFVSNPIDACRDHENCQLVADLSDSEKANYANWFSYFRKRGFNASSAMINVFKQSEDYVGLATFRNLISRPPGETPVRPGRTVKDLSITVDENSNGIFDNKEALIRAVSARRLDAGTPLSLSLIKAGQYFENGDLSLFSGDVNPANSPIQIETGGACQHNFTVLVTDGEETTGSVQSAIDRIQEAIDQDDADGDSSISFNADGDSNSDFDGGIFGDNRSNTLADFAMHFFERDLAPNIENLVPLIPGADYGSFTGNKLPQHMITYGVGFGVEPRFIDCNPTDSALDENGELLCSIGVGENQTEWPSSAEVEDAQRGGLVVSSVDDATHAAFNARGEFLSASNPQELTSSLQDILDSISVRTGGASAVSTNSATLSTDTNVFLTSFESRFWSGNVSSFPVATGTEEDPPGCLGLSAGDVCFESEWETSQTLSKAINSFDNRRILIFDENSVDEDNPNGRAVPFRFESLDIEDNPDDLAALFSQNVPVGIDSDEYGELLVNYLRGDNTHEIGPNNGGGAPLFRQRGDSVLGDIVNSVPVFVGEPALNFPDVIGPNNFEGQPYSEFVENNSVRPEGLPPSNDTRLPVLYFGANDGMLHAVNAHTGDFLFSYIPKTSVENIPLLTQSDYTHEFYVDGPLTVGDAFIDGDGDSDEEWQSILLGSHRSGGRGVFALNVTDPDQFVANEQVLADRLVMWEFSDPRLGLTFSQPDIVRLNNGTWAAIFASGYNNGSTDGSNYLFVVDISNGELIQAVPADDFLDSGQNGMGTVTPVDIDGDFDVDYVYGGDLFGNLWRFDLTAETSNSWNATKVFTAMSPTLPAAPQPITTRPSVGLHPDPNIDGLIVYFGTGRFFSLEDRDSSNQITQTFYAVWDEFAFDNNGILLPVNDSLPLSRASLLQQSITSEVEIEGFDFPVRLTSDELEVNYGEQRGWLIDFVSPVNGSNRGERVVVDSILRGDRIIFVTSTPTGELCTGGGTSAVMELDAENGTPLASPPLDLDGDGVFDTVGEDAAVPSGVILDGLVGSPTIIGTEDGSIEHKIFSSTSGSTVTLGERPPSGATNNRVSWREVERR